MADWQGTKGMWVDKMLDPCCDFQRSPHPWPWPWISKVKFLNGCIYECEGSSTSNERGISRQGVIPTMWPSAMTLTLDFQGEILKIVYLRNGKVDSLRMKGMWVGYDVGCTMGLTLGHGAWQIDWPSNGPKNPIFTQICELPHCNSSLNSPKATKRCTKLEAEHESYPFVFSCDQAALQMVFSVRLSVCRVPFSLCYPHLTYDDEMMHTAWCCLEEVSYCFSRSSVKFQGHTGQKNLRFWPQLGVSGL